MVQKRIREEARKLLENKEVDVVVGFGEGSLPLRATPLFIRKPEEADRLIWNAFCENNLAVYLHKLDPLRVGLVVKGCDARSVTALSQERRFRNQPPVLIGVPCQRMVDRRKVKKAVPEEILKAVDEGDEIVVSGEGYQLSLKKEEFLYPSCRVCTHRNPAQARVLVADPVEKKALAGIHPDMAAFEKMTPAERWDFFEKEVNRCMRCYACREACPMCYCKECFVDNSRPKWIEKSLNPRDLQFYHIVRAYHQTGRCTACGACERACPMEIRLNYMTQKLNQDVKDLYTFETGIESETPPPLSTYETEDRQEFIK